MSTIEVERLIRRKIKEKVVLARNGLESFAYQVAKDARRAAPVRKLVRYDRRKHAARMMSDELFEAMKKGAERTSWIDKKTGKVMKGSMTSGGVYRPARRPKTAMDRRNLSGSKYRTLGRIKKTTTREVKWGGMPNVLGGSLRPTKKWQGEAFAKGPGIKKEETRHFEFKRRKGVRIEIDLEASARASRAASGLRVKSVSNVGRGVLRYSSSRQRYDISHGRGLRISGNKVVYGGTLKHSIEAEEVTPNVWRVQTAVPYAKFVEFGTRHMAAQPFLIPAMVKNRRRMSKHIADAMRG